MKKLLCSMFFIIMFASAAFPEARADVYRNSNYDLLKVKTVLLLPLIYDITIPETEAFFVEKVSQKWIDLINSSTDKLSFLIKTPVEIVARENFIKGVTEPEKLSSEKTLEKALSLSDQQVDAILSSTITQCSYSNTYHPEELVWRSRIERRRVKVDGKWRDVEIPVRYHEIKPAWDETFAHGSLKIELRDSKTNELIYGISVVAKTGSGFLTPTPSLTKEISNVLEYAVKRIDLK